MPGPLRFLSRIQGFLQRPAVQQIRTIISTVREGAATVAIGPATPEGVSRAGPSPFRNPRAYSKLIAYAATALFALVSRWTGHDIAADLQPLLIEVAITFVGGWGIWRLPNKAAS